jgi:hypothetical protein
MAEGRVLLEDDADSLIVTAPGYRLTVDRTGREARLVVGGTDWGRLSLLATVDRTDYRDETHRIAETSVREQADARLVLEVAQASSAWHRKATVLTCTPDAVEVHVEVEGAGRISEVMLLGGRAILPTGAAGTFRSQLLARSVFDPTPTQPVAVVRPATSSVALGVVGDAEPGRLNAIFSPPPLLVVLGTGAPRGATKMPEGAWLSLAVREQVRRLTFTQLRYEPLDGGYLLRLDYEGHTRVAGAWASPRLVLAGAESPYDAVADYRAMLETHGLAEGPPMPARAWWERTIFCGWGAQCAEAAVNGGTAAALARQDLYDQWLAQLEERGLEPGTIVIDDKWQAEYGLPEVDAEKWPDLRRWIEDRHVRGQRVLLWWRAWAPDGLPIDECVLDATGRPVAADPSNPAYQKRLYDTMAALLGPGGLDADGLKVDFTQRAPSGASLVAYGESWGIALLHELLSGIYSAAKAANPDALVITHTPHPSFGDVCDMVRLNDVLDTDTEQRPVAAAEQLRFRHAVVTRSMPGHLIDTDQWPMQTRADWLGYAREQAGLGVPSLYYVTAIDNSREPITGADLEQVAAWWGRR